MLLDSQVVVVLLRSRNLNFLQKVHSFLPNTNFWCISSQSLTCLEVSGAGEHAIIFLSFRPCWHELISFASYLPTLLQIPWTTIVHDYWPLRGWTKDILAQNLFEIGLLQKEGSLFCGKDYLIICLR